MSEAVVYGYDTKFVVQAVCFFIPHFYISPTYAILIIVPTFFYRTCTVQNEYTTINTKSCSVLSHTPKSEVYTLNTYENINHFPTINLAPAILIILENKHIPLPTINPNLEPHPEHRSLHQ